jgi:hypothetical protein
VQTSLKLAALAATLILAACGGGDDDDPADPGAGGGGGGGGSTTLTCRTAGYTAGSVAVPTSTELAAYTGTFNGEEGSYALDGSFTKAGDATLAYAGAGTLSYKGTSYSVTSVCLDVAAGPYGRILYVEAGTAGHFDIASASAGADLGQAWGVSPADGATVFRKGLKP